MEDNRKISERTRQRDFECNRLEEQLWTMAYEQVWPVIHRSLKRATELRQRREGSNPKSHIARRA
jgi:hypothetical protein